ncbi:XVIPCD domain-containing protein [Lysobacter sp. 22409]|uniref:XVIPCD domain-containing protein n=1 Tax=Lysobacter sp. 22409 TaxID=3453917 RepID=UPI003F86A04B
MTEPKGSRLAEQPGFQALPQRTRDWILQSPHATADFAAFFEKGGRVEPASHVDLPYYHATEPPKIYISAKTYADLTGPDAPNRIDTELRLFATLAHEIGHDKHHTGTEPFRGKTADEYVEYRSRLEAKTVFNAYPIFDDLQKSDPAFRAKWDAIGYGRGSGLEPAGIYSEWKSGRIDDDAAIARLAAPIPNFPYTRREPLTDLSGDGVLTQRDAYLRDYAMLVRPPVSEQQTDPASRGQPQGAVSRSPTEPGHRDHGLYAQIAGHVRAQDQQHGRQWDQTSERLTASLLALSKEAGLTQVDHVVFSTRTDRVAAGENVFVVQGRLDDPAHLRAHMKTEEATRTSESISFAKVEALSERALGQAPMQTQMQDELARGPSIGR